MLNGLAGSLYGPATPAGVFNYTLKRPTDVPFATYTQGFDSNSVFTEHIDAGGRTPDGTVGYRFNVVHGQGESYAPESHADRTLASGALDFHIGDRTVVETNFSHYQTNITGLPGSIVYFGKPSIVLPNAVDPTRLGYGQPGAGTDSSSPIPVSSRSSMRSTMIGISRLAASIRMPCAICSASPIR